MIEELVKAKRDLGISNRDLALAAGVHETTLSSILRGRLKPNIEQEAILSAILNVNIDEGKTNG